MSWRGLDVFRTEALPTGTVLRPRRLRAQEVLSPRNRRSRRAGSASPRPGRTTRRRPPGPGRRSPARSRPSRSAAISYSRFSVVLNIGGSSELIVTTTPASTNARSGCSSRVATARVAMLDDGHTSSGIRCSARWASSAGSGGRRRAVPDPLGAQQSGARPRSSPVRSSPRRAARECRPAARAAAKCGSNCGRDTPTSGPPSPNADQPVGRVVERVAQGGVGGRHAGLARDVVDPAQHQPEVALRGDPGVLDGLGVGLDRHPADHRGVRRAGQLGVPHRLALGHLAGDLVGQQPHVLGRADQVDHREVDLDEVREVAELEERAQLPRGPTAPCRGAARPARRRSAATPSRRGGRAARPWAGRR